MARYYHVEPIRNRCRTNRLCIAPSFVATPLARGMQKWMCLLHLDKKSFHTVDVCMKATYHHGSISELSQSINQIFPKQSKFRPGLRIFAKKYPNKCGYPIAPQMKQICSSVSQIHKKKWDDWVSRPSKVIASQIWD